MKCGHEIGEVMSHNFIDEIKKYNVDHLIGLERLSEALAAEAQNRREENRRHDARVKAYGDSMVKVLGSAERMAERCEDAGKTILEAAKSFTEVRCCGTPNMHPCLVYHCR